MNETGRQHLRWMLALLGCACLALIVCAPVSAHRLERGFWGPAAIDGVSQFPIYDQLGVTIYQTTLSWATIARRRPADPRDPADPAPPTHLGERSETRMLSKMRRSPVGTRCCLPFEPPANASQRAISRENALGYA